MDEFTRGFEAARKAVLEALAKVAYQTGSQPNAYSPWVWTDRPAHDVKQDCIAVAANAKPPV